MLKLFHQFIERNKTYMTNIQVQISLTNVLWFISGVWLQCLGRDRIYWHQILHLYLFFPSDYCTGCRVLIDRFRLEDTRSKPSRCYSTLYISYSTCMSGSSSTSTEIHLFTYLNIRTYCTVGIIRTIECMKTWSWWALTHSLSTFYLYSTDTFWAEFSREDKRCEINNK